MSQFTFSCIFKKKKKKYRPRHQKSGATSLTRKFYLERVTRFSWSFFSFKNKTIPFCAFRQSELDILFSIYISGSSIGRKDRVEKKNSEIILHVGYNIKE